MTEDEVLDVAEACADTVRRAEVDLLRVVYQWAVLHSAERLDPVESAKPGREKARRFGGAGTPEVTEFAAAELGVRIGRSPWAARQLIADALDLRHRHPQLWARVEAGEVRASYARHVVAKTRDLERDEAAYVDAAVVESADGRIAWSRFEALVAAKVAQAAPERARERELRAQRATFAKRLRGEADGMSSYLVRADLATIEAIDAGFARKAREVAEARPDDPDLQTEDQRLVRAVLLAATGADAGAEEADLLPVVELVVHVYAGSDREGVARIQGHGPVTEEWLRQVLGPQARFRVQPVLDLAGQAPVDAYEIPDRHRKAVQLIMPADTFPFASCTSTTMQVDHTVPHDEGGVSGIGNYGPMTTGHHRVKTHGAGWQVQQPFPGIFVWCDPGGVFYLVDHTGTRRIPEPEHERETERPRPSGKPVVVELWHTTVDVRYDAA